MKLDFPATTRNREPIAEVLEKLWDPGRPREILEVASGSGQHLAYLARRFPLWTFQPSDLEPAHLASIAAYRQEAGVDNFKEPIRLDVEHDPWPVLSPVDTILAINLIHISPWACTLSLLSQGRRLLRKGGDLYLYGAFQRGGLHTASSNEAFDHALRRQNPEWGVRDLDQVTAAAVEAGFRLERVVEMPANNLSVLFQGS